MRRLLALAVLALACDISLIAQTDSSNESRPGLAGDASCRVYFSVIRAGKAANVVKPNGLSEDELQWWQEEGHKKARGLCYLSGTTGQMPNVKAQCRQCPEDWLKSFYWFVISSTEEGLGGRAESGVPETVQPQHRQSSSTGPDDIQVTRFPSSTRQSVDLTLTITADIYSGFAADSSSNPQTVHLRVKKKRAFNEYQITDISPLNIWPLNVL